MASQKIGSTALRGRFCSFGIPQRYDHQETPQVPGVSHRSRTCISTHLLSPSCDFSQRHQNYKQWRFMARARWRNPAWLSLQGLLHHNLSQMLKIIPPPSPPAWIPSKQEGWPILKTPLAKKCSLDKLNHFAPPPSNRASDCGYFFPYPFVAAFPSHLVYYFFGRLTPKKINSRAHTICGKHYAISYTTSCRCWFYS